MREPTRVTIEFEATDPVSGRVLDESGDSNAFAGWLDLLTLLQAAHADEPGAAGNLVEPPR